MAYAGPARLVFRACPVAGGGAVAGPECRLRMSASKMVSASVVAAPTAIRIAVRRDRSPEKPVTMSLSFPVRGMVCSHQSYDTTPRNVRRRASLTFRRAVLSDW